MAKDDTQDLFVLTATYANLMLMRLVHMRDHKHMMLISHGF